MYADGYDAQGPGFGRQLYPEAQSYEAYAAAGSPVIHEPARIQVTSVLVNKYPLEGPAWLHMAGARREVNYGAKPVRDDFWAVHVFDQDAPPIARHELRGLPVASGTASQEERHRLLAGGLIQLLGRDALEGQKVRVG